MHDMSLKARQKRTIHLKTLREAADWLHHFERWSSSPKLENVYCHHRKAEIQMHLKTCFQIAKTSLAVRKLSLIKFCQTFVWRAHHEKQFSNLNWPQKLKWLALQSAFHKNKNPFGFLENSVNFTQKAGHCYKNLVTFSVSVSSLTAFVTKSQLSSRIMSFLGLSKCEQSVKNSKTRYASACLFG